jgi:hypothetical protein
MCMQLAHELVAPRRLEERVSGILLRLEKELDQAEVAIGELQCAWVAMTPFRYRSTRQSPRMFDATVA